MSQFKTIALFNPTASPQTGVADGASIACKTIARTDGAQQGGRSELVVVQVTGTWGGGTINPQITLDYGTSPEVWTNVQAIASAGTLADVAITADAVLQLEIPSGVYFRLNLTGATGASLTARARGDIESA